MRHRLLASWIGVALCGAPGLASAEGDPEGAERQYRIARRLAAEKSPDAHTALQKVVELDPSGALADDALVEQALLEPISRWPEDLGRISNGVAVRAFSLLGGVIEDLPGSDRAAEARLYRGLLRLEALPQHDPSAARLDLLNVATDPQAGAWAWSARYAAAWLSEKQGQIDRAAEAYQRLVIEAPGDSSTARAKVGLARVRIREGRFGEAADWLQQAIDEQVAPETRARFLRELAVRRLLRDVDAGPPPPVLEIRAPSTGVRVLAGLAADPDGGVLLADRRTASVVHLAPDGSTVARWELDEPQAVAVNSSGRIYAAAGERIYRLAPGEPPFEIASQGTFAPVSAMTVDDLGRVWVLDRRGEQIGLVRVGQKTPRKFGPDLETRMNGLAWDGRRLVGLQTRARALLAFEADGSSSVLADQLMQRPTALAADPSGRIAVLDSKAARIVWFDRNGRSLVETDLRASGVERPSAIGFSLDGALHLFDEAIDGWVTLK